MIPSSRPIRSRCLACLAFLALAVAGPAVDAADAHAGPTPAAKGTVESTHPYVVPPVSLTRADGRVVSLPDEMNDGRPVVLNFVFTTCPSICPMMSSLLSQFQHRLGAEADKVHVMSISIDPEQDTPSRLLDYSRKFDAGPGWQFYTGTVQASITVQRAFDVYRGDKMSHNVVMLMRAAPGKPWLRIEGFATADDLLRAYRGVVAGRLRANADGGNVNFQSP